MCRRAQAKYRQRQKEQAERDRHTIEGLNARLAALEMDRDQLARRNDLLQKVAAIKESEPAPAVLATDHVEVCLASFFRDPHSLVRAPW